MMENIRSALNRTRRYVTVATIDAAMDLAKASAPLVITVAVVATFYRTVMKQAGEAVNTPQDSGTTGS